MHSDGKIIIYNYNYSDTYNYKNYNSFWLKGIFIAASTLNVATKVAIKQIVKTLHQVTVNWFYSLQGVTEIQVQNWTMYIKTKKIWIFINDKKHLTA